MTVTNLDSNFTAINLKLIIKLSSIINIISQLMFTWIDNQNRKPHTINHTHKSTRNIQGEKSPITKQKTFWGPIAWNVPLIRIAALWFSYKILRVTTVYLASNSYQQLTLASFFLISQQIWELN